MNNNYYVDFHILQTVPPSCVNRDDANSPKTAVYGGTVRARVSSQAWKHAIREEFINLYDADKQGKRTKKIVDMIADEALKINPSLVRDNVMKDAASLLGEAKIKKDDKKLEAKALFFLSSAQAKNLAKLCVDPSQHDKKERATKVKAALMEHPSADMALFGRMVADDPSINYDAAAQVAHAISTHSVQTEYDYFTAVDDLSPEENAGAAHLGTVEFNSSTLYRYASLNVRELYQSLGDDTEEAAVNFAKALILSMPSGKQNTFANRTVPDLVYVAIRTDQPVNLCGAFEEAIPQGKYGYAARSVAKLFEYAQDVYGSFVPVPEEEYIVGKNSSGKATLPLAKMLDELGTKIDSYIATLQGQR